MSVIFAYRGWSCWGFRHLRLRDRPPHLRRGFSSTRLLAFPSPVLHASALRFRWDTAPTRQLTFDKRPHDTSPLTRDQGDLPPASHTSDLTPDESLTSDERLTFDERPHLRRDTSTASHITCGESPRLQHIHTSATTCGGNAAPSRQRRDGPNRGIQRTLRIQNTVLQQIVDLLNDTRSEVQGLQTVVGGLRTEVGELRTAVQGLRTDVRESQNSLNRLERDDEAPLQYPDWVQLEPPLPMSRRDLLQLTIQDCDATTGILGLPSLGQHPTVEHRRRQISQYLGLALPTGATESRTSLTQPLISGLTHHHPLIPGMAMWRKRMDRNRSLRGECKLFRPPPHHLRKLERLLNIPTITTHAIPTDTTTLHLRRVDSPSKTMTILSPSPRRRTKSAEEIDRYLQWDDANGMMRGSRLRGGGRSSWGG
ncbi:hypothetical protein DFH27DRAFT_609512 [Peziza echinospora]|nr:hypothetical protein DFH27DRAFT_609512 [Peziza echinospora]